MMVQIASSFGLVKTKTSAAMQAVKALPNLTKKAGFEMLDVVSSRPE